MIKYVTYLGKVYASLVFTLFKVFALASLTIVFATVVTIWLTYNTFFDNDSVYSMWTLLRFIMILGVWLGVIFTINLGYKYAFEKTIHRLVSDHVDTIIIPFMNLIFKKLESTHEKVFSNLSEKSISRVTLIKSLVGKADNILLRKVVSIGIRRINLSATELANKDGILPSIIQARTLSIFLSIAKPKRRYIVASYTFQWAILFAILFMK